MADSNLIWMTNMRYNIFPTRDYEVDKMMKIYSLKKYFYSGLLQPSMVVFRTDSNSNLAPLAKKMKKYIGVKAAESEFMYGDGNDITDSVNEKYTELIYSYGWQECPTGCEQRRYWKFRIYSDCSVEYRASYGRPLEPALILSVHEDKSYFSDVHIYANPVKTKIYVECNTKKTENISLTLSNKKEEIVYKLNKLRGKQEVDMILLPNGTYYLTLESNSRTKVFLIKKR